MEVHSSHIETTPSPRHAMGLKNLPLLVAVPLSFLSWAPTLCSSLIPLYFLEHSGMLLSQGLCTYCVPCLELLFPRRAVSLLLLQLFAQMSPFWPRSILTLCLILKTHQHLLSLALIVATGHNLYFVCLLWIEAPWGQGFFFPQLYLQCLAHSRCFLSICWTDEWMPERWETLRTESL